MEEKLPIEKYMSKNFFVLSSCIFLFLSFSCKTPEKAIKEKPAKLSPDYLLEQLNRNKKEFVWFSAKCRTGYKDENRTQSFTVNIRMKKDSIIWASITSIMGVEAARVLITSDSVLIIDRMNKQFFKKSFVFLENYVPFTLNLNILQDIIIGNAIMEDDFKVKSRVEKSHYLLTLEYKKLENNIWIEPGSYNISTEHLVDKQLNRNLTLIFSNYKSIENIEFAYQRKIDFKSNDKVEIDLKFSKLKWNEPLLFPFYVSDSYENRF